eukprot:SM000030S11481  [mRNA]  locus=s30:898409:899940:+ [translate_table: standard]
MAAASRDVPALPPPPPPPPPPQPPLLVFQCQQCHLALSDSTLIAGSDADLNLVALRGVSCAEIVPDELRTSTSGKDAGRGYICLETHAIVSYELGTSSASEGTGIGSQIMMDNQSDTVKLCHLETQIIKVMPDPSMSALIENLLLLYNERLEFLEEALDEVVNGTGS